MSALFRFLTVALVAAGLAAFPSLRSAESAEAAAAAPTMPPVKHVFMIVYENKGYDATWGPDSAAPYLATTLRSQGVLATNYYGIGHVSLDNYIAMVSGQGPNPQTQSDCQYFTDFVRITTVDPGQAVGSGCVFPADVPTIASQLDAAGFTWRGYMEQMGSPCRHPDLNTQDQTQSAKPEDNYATRHNPFMYFHGVIDRPRYCKRHDVDLSALAQDLKRVRTTRNLTFITPDLCHDGHDTPCANGEPGGLVSFNDFLKHWVPKIMRSPAFRRDGLLIITADENDFSSDPNDTSCCGEGPGPNSPLPGVYGMGGGKIGALMISPKWIEGGSTSDQDYNHYSWLRSVEDLFGLDHIGYASIPEQSSFGPDIFNKR